MEGLIAAGAVLVFVLFMLITAASAQKCRLEAINREFPKGTAVLGPASCNFFGVKSRGSRQMRGNGILILTGAGIVFRMLIPERELRVPVRSIESIEKVRSHLGKTKNVPLLRIGFRNSENLPDSVAWAVRDVDGWIKALEEMRAGGG